MPQASNLGCVRRQLLIYLNHRARATGRAGMRQSGDPWPSAGLAQRKGASCSTRAASARGPAGHPPRRVVGYLKGLAGGDRIFYAGHNPAGGVMVLALIAVLLAQVATGLFANDGVRFHGPLALLVSEDASTRLTDIHGLIFDLILILVWCHVVAVGFYLLVKGENLIRPMVTGKKYPAHLPAELNIVFTRLYIALLLLAVSAGIAAWIMIQGETIL